MNRRIVIQMLAEDSNVHLQHRRHVNWGNIGVLSFASFGTHYDVTHVLVHKLVVMMALVD